MTAALRQPSFTGKRASDRVPPQWWEGEFAVWLRQAMADRDLSMRMLSMRAGINHSTICRLMKGDRDPSLTTALALLRVLAREPLRVRPDISLLAD
ncbi:MAG TPA: helix-turn-helix transcriptional regulator [Candidatus Limnocylindria bacterium]